MLCRACRFLIWSWAFFLVTSHDWTLAEMVGRDAQGRPTYSHRPLPAEFKNPISDADEQSFQERARAVIAAQGKLKVAAGNTYFENEKRTYGYLMAQVLAGNPDAVKNLQLEDAQAKEWHRETSGIDLFACFTLKHQVRKYFYFGDLLEDAYQERMRSAAKSWTSQDPLRRPHYFSVFIGMTMPRNLAVGATASGMTGQNMPGSSIANQRPINRPRRSSRAGIRELCTSRPAAQRFSVKLAPRERPGLRLARRRRLQP